MFERPRAFGVERPPVWLGAVVSLIAVTLATAAIYPLKSVAPAVSLSVVYLPAVLLISVYWGIALGLLTSLMSAAAFNFFHIPPVGRFTIADARNWVALATFTLVAVVVSGMAELARSRAQEAEQRRAEADLAAGLARELLSGAETQAALASTAHRVSEALTIPSAAIRLGTARAGERQSAIPLRGAAGEPIATLLVPRGLPHERSARLQGHVVPVLEALVAIALRRDAVQAEAVETAALRHSDQLKTALLRAVSHDLRTPITAIVATGHALGAQSLTEAERLDLSKAIVEEGERLSALVQKLLDLSRLEAGRAEPRRSWISLEEVLLACKDSLREREDQVRLVLDPELPPVRADAVQLEQVFSNLLENGLRYTEGLPVVVRVRRAGNKIVARVVDQGPGISPSEQERIFEPFYRGTEATSRRSAGSGLGLSIAKGFIEANGGSIKVESLPGQGTAFVVELPLEEVVPVAS